MKINSLLYNAGNSDAENEKYLQFIKITWKRHTAIRELRVKEWENEREIENEPIMNDTKFTFQIVKWSLCV